MKKNQLCVTHGKNGVFPLPVVRDEETVDLYSRLVEEVGLWLITLPLELVMEKRRARDFGVKSGEKR
jgi:hypothetical protein